MRHIGALLLLLLPGCLIGDFFVERTFSGAAVDGAGDIDGDGHDDVLVLARFQPQPDRFGAQLRLYSGRDGSLMRSDALRASTIACWPLVDGGGDANGDGVPDWLVCAAFEPDEELLSAMRVYSGKDGQVLHEVLLQEGELSFLWPDMSAWIGDYDDDGCTDFGGIAVLVNAEEDQAPFGLRIFSGRTGSLLQSLQSPSGAGWGVFIALIPDRDGDGCSDILASTRPLDTPEEDPQVYSLELISTRNGKVLRKLDLVNPDPEVDGLRFYAFLEDVPASELTIVAKEPVPIYLRRDGGLVTQHLPLLMSLFIPFWPMTESLTMIGDINADGYHDAAADLQDEIVLFSGKDASELRRMRTDGFTTKIADAGDLNGDGCADVIAGFMGAALEGYGSAVVYSGRDGSELYRFDGEPDRMGSAGSAVPSSVLQDPALAGWVSHQGGSYGDITLLVFLRGEDLVLEAYGRQPSHGRRATSPQWPAQVVSAVATGEEGERSAFFESRSPVRPSSGEAQVKAKDSYAVELGRIPLHGLDPDRLVVEWTASGLRFEDVVRLISKP